MKTCNCCQQTKPLTEFFRNQGMPDGLLKQCKICTQKKNREYRNTETGKAARKREKQYPEVKKRYKQSEKGKLSTKQYKRDPTRVASKNAVRYAIKTGKLQKQPCFVCGEVGQAHHSSYAQDMKLVVTWLCQQHHNQLHIEHLGYKSWCNTLVQSPSPGVIYTAALPLEVMPVK